MIMSRETIGKIVRLGLPLSALILLSMVFLVARSIDPNQAAGVAELDATQITREPRISAARFAGVSQDRTALTISAQSVQSATPRIGEDALDLSFLRPTGAMSFPNGSSAQFHAETAHLDASGGVLRAQGPVTLENSDGFRLRLGSVEALLDRTRLSSDGGVQGQAPAGDIRADALELTRSGGPDGGYLLAFTGNVRLIYRPESR